LAHAKSQSCRIRKTVWECHEVNHALILFILISRKLPKKIVKKTKAVMVVHLFGLCVDMNVINAFIPNNLRIKEGNHGWQSYLPTAIQKK
jgi:hypothetical protein